MDRTVTNRLLLSAVASLALPVGPLLAQNRTPSKATAVARRPLNGACAAIASAPSELARTPEGVALLRFKRELDGAATIIEQRGATVEGTDARRMMDVQRGLDSLMRVFVRVHTGEGGAAGAGGGGNTTIVMRRGDSTITVVGKPLEGRVISESMESAIKAMRPNIDITLRAIEPQVVNVSGPRAASGGYLGINLSGSQIRMVTDSGSFTAHCDYPLIEAVDVGSPARRAGLLAGDTVMAYNGRDVVAQVVNYPQMLVPGKVVKVRIRRDGKAREVPVTVAERPQEVAETNFRFVPGGMLTPVPRMAPGTGVGAVTAAPGGGRVIVRTGPGGSMASAGSISGSGAMLSLYGAQLNAVDDEFAQSLGLEPGVLVMRVLPGSAAAEAGLKPGEVIRAVNGVPVRELAPIQRAAAISGARDMKLTVMGRDTPPRIVTIRW